MNDHSRPILHAASQARQRIFLPRFAYMKADVMLINLVDADRQQLSLLDTPQSAADGVRSEKLMATMDDLNKKIGRGTLRLGMPTDGAAWHLRCANRTPRWSTRWEEILQVRVL